MHDIAQLRGLNLNKENECMLNCEKIENICGNNNENGIRLSYK
jgi:hypothetical protein